MNNQCMICLEEDIPVVEGLTCKSSDQKHFICNQCFGNYVLSCCREGSIIRGEKKLEIFCPCCNCSPFTLEEIIESLRDSKENLIALETYIRTIKDYAMTLPDATSNSDEIDIVHHVSKALNLVCPNKKCNAILDPGPDGCSAITCSACKTNFCFLCMKIEKSSRLNHKHVRELCPYNPSNSYFANQYAAQGQKAVRIKNLRNIGVAREGVNWRDDMSLRKAFENDSVKALLLMQKITVKDVYADDELGPGRQRDNRDELGPGRQRDNRDRLMGMIIVGLIALVIGTWYGSQNTNKERSSSLNAPTISRSEDIIVKQKITTDTEDFSTFYLLIVLSFRVISQALFNFISMVRLLVPTVLRCLKAVIKIFFWSAKTILSTLKFIPMGLSRLGKLFFSFIF